MKQNLHTHSIFCDGKDTPRQLAETAIEKGFTDLGFSSHGYNQPMDEWSLDDEREAAYIKEINQLKKEYAGKLNIWLGIEEDLAGRTYDHDTFDYIIGSVHFVPAHPGMLPADYSEQRTEQMIHDIWNDDFLAYAKDYWNEVAKLAERPEVDIAGHVDLLMKYNEDERMFPFEDPEYLTMAKSAISKLISAGKIIEVNTGAISRGYRTQPYPHQSLLKYICLQGGKITLTSDCHARENLDCAFDQAIQYIKEAGFTEIQVLTDQGFVSHTL